MTLCPDCALAQQTTRPSYSPSSSVGSLPSRISDTPTARRCLEISKQWLWGEGLRGLERVYVVLRYLPDAAGQSVLGTDRIELDPDQETSWSLGVLVHECCHHWLHYNGVRQSEGFCHLAMREFFLRMNTAKTRHHAWSIETEAPYEYREGLRRCISASQRAGGFRQYVAQVKSSRQLAA